MSEYIVDLTTFTPARQNGKQPIVREEIVRCRDCRAMRVKYGNTGIECWKNGEPFTVEPNGFCAWGVKRKEGGDD